MAPRQRAPRRAGASAAFLACSPTSWNGVRRFAGTHGVGLSGPRAARLQLHGGPRPTWAVSRRFGSVFPSLNMAVKRREQALQDYRRLQAKVEKYEEKEKTGPVLAKLHQVPREGRGGGGRPALGPWQQGPGVVTLPPAPNTHRAPRVDAGDARRALTAASCSAGPRRAAACAGRLRGQEQAAPG